MNFNVLIVGATSHRATKKPMNIVHIVSGIYVTFIITFFMNEIVGNMFILKKFSVVTSACPKLGINVTITAWIGYMIKLPITPINQKNILIAKLNNADSMLSPH